MCAIEERVAVKNFQEQRKGGEIGDLRKIFLSMCREQEL